MSFSGTLVEVCKTANGTFVPIPLKFMAYETYKAVRRVMDLDPTRDTTGVLHRNALPHTSVTIAFETPHMNNRQINDLMGILRTVWINPLERDCYMRYYIPELDDYATAHVYLQEPEFPMRNVDAAKQVINYLPVKLEFTGY